MFTLRVINYVLYSLILIVLILSMIRFARMKNNITLCGPRIAALEKEIADLTNENRVLKTYLEENTDFNMLKKIIQEQEKGKESE